MKVLITLITALFLLVTIGLHPISKGVRGSSPREIIHMNRVPHTLASVESGSDGVGAPIFDRGHNSWFN